MIANCLRERTENNSKLRKLPLKRGGDGDAIEHCVNRNPREHLLLLQRNSELLISTQNFRVELIQTLELHLLLGSGVVNDVLVIDRRILHVRPLGLSLSLRERSPVPVGLKPPLQHELRFTFLGRNEADHILVQTLGDPFFLNIGDEAPLVLAFGKISNCVKVRAHWVLPEILLMPGTSFPRSSLMAINCNG